MTTLAIEISDIGLEAACESGPIGMPSPGYAHLDGGELVTGEAARAAARLEPRFVNHKYWDQLDLRSVGRPFPRALRHADVAHAHLTQYFRRAVAEAQLSLRQTSVLLALSSPLQWPEFTPRWRIPTREGKLRRRQP